jgi:chromosome partitioning protein
MSADAILIPVCDAAFDRESAAACLSELMALPRVATGRCKVAMVGMRIDARTKGAARLGAWAEGLGVPFLGSVRETQVYVRSAEQGLTLFDLPAAKVEGDLAQWRPIVDWLDATWQAAERLQTKAKGAADSLPARSVEPVSKGRTVVPASPPAAPAHAPVPAREPAAMPTVDLRAFLSPLPRRPAARLGWLFSVFRSST